MSQTEQVPTKQTEYIPIAEIADRLDCSRDTVYKAIAKKQLPCVEVGDRRIVPRAAFESLMQGEKAGSMPDPEEYAKKIRIAELNMQLKSIEHELAELTQ